MKKTLVAILLIAGVAGADAQSFQKGDIVIDAALGVGADRDKNQTYNSANNTINTEKTNKVTFTQRLGVEFGVCNFGDRSSLGIGIDFQNSVGSTHHYVVGTYDYSYVRTTYDRIIDPTTNRPGNGYTTSSATIDRMGKGSAAARAEILDFNLTLRAAFHHEFIDNLDTYAGIGFGLARAKYHYSDYTDLAGFDSETRRFDPSLSDMVQFSYSYDDLDHVKWQDGGAKARYALALYAGMRYFFNDHWAINAELGLPVVTLKSAYNHYNVFSVGASYKF